MTRDTQDSSNVRYDERVLYYWITSSFPMYERCLFAIILLSKPTKYSAFLFRFGFFIWNNIENRDESNGKTDNFENICAVIFYYLLLPLLKILCA